MTALVLSLMLHAEPLSPPNGTPIAVEVKIGTVAIEVQGRLIPCVKNRRCAQLPSGRRVIGHVEQDRFVVEETP
ncbi:MAG: hypothetical protein IPJ65_10270 [Archangiaceae bacterium]|nr:hypothetical protein [Archangiaceae bacterium]